jgi:hypothetical protein
MEPIPERLPSSALGHHLRTGAFSFFGTVAPFTLSAKFLSIGFLSVNLVPVPEPEPAAFAPHSHAHSISAEKSILFTSGVTQLLVMK